MIEKITKFAVHIASRDPMWVLGWDAIYGKRY